MYFCTVWTVDSPNFLLKQSQRNHFRAREGMITVLLQWTCKYMVRNEVLMATWARLVLKHFKVQNNICYYFTMLSLGCLLNAKQPSVVFYPPVVVCERYCLRHNLIKMHWTPYRSYADFVAYVTLDNSWSCCELILFCCFLDYIHHLNSNI